MKAKLNKVDNGYVLLVDNIMYATDNDKLSKQNCDEIFGVVDVEKLAEERFGKSLHHANSRACFREGFNKAMELNKDKVFTKEDMRRAYIQGTNDGAQFESMMDYDSEDNNDSQEFAEEAEKDFIQSLQQPTEIEVEIEMTDNWLKSKVESCPNFHPKFGCSDISKCVCRDLKFDSEGCLILKKI
jgi:hypothetical protein